MTQEAIVRRKLADEILDRLLAMIASGEIQPGGRLPGERELMKRFATGRPAVREALQTLANMGVIQIQHGERARLRQLEPKGLLDRMDLSVRHMLQASPETERHLREARLMFECAMVRVATQNALPEDVAALEGTHAALVDAAGEPARFVRNDIRFHVGIAAISRNPLFAAFSESLLGWLLESQPHLLRVPGTEAITVREHEAILNAVRSSNAEEAVQAMTAHLTRSDPGYRARPGGSAGNGLGK